MLGSLKKAVGEKVKAKLIKTQIKSYEKIRNSNKYDPAIVETCNHIIKLLREDGDTDDEFREQCTILSGLLQAKGQRFANKMMGG